MLQEKIHSDLRFFNKTLRSKIEETFSKELFLTTPVTSLDATKMNDIKSKHFKILRIY